MATNSWTGGANDGNWSTPGNWSLGAIPVDTNDVIISAGAMDITTMPSVIPPTGTLASFTVGPGFKGSIGGSSGGSANISATVVSVSMGGAAIFFGTGTRTTVNIDGTGRGAAFITAGTNTTINVGLGASLDIGGTAVYTTLNSAGRVNDANGTAATTCNIGAGVYRTYRSVSALNLGSGAVAQYLLTASISTSAKIEGSARLNWQSSGVLSGLTLMPNSTFDVEGCLYSFSITGTLTQWAGSSYNTAGIGIAVTDSGATKVFIGKRS